ncbi:NADPH:quinone reductase-like Zn-dependent oxidoreductase [Geomicrobium halophilum]|uniref:NADPH:quinone reductase-like Zn-dependent oxidoreductase n=1 Tax=Geomicrobium halophilum TaxID=549000 RepID=A0A841PPS6_9BACL|nr:NADPH:quinone reductase-like Zn-dependent oxidoreductase [Geomicrobium halophilum]
MKAVGIQQFGGREQLHLLDIEKPALGKHDVLIEMYATSVNPIDFKIREGKRQNLNFPVILGSDVAGIVIEKGTEVTHFSVGDRVFATPEKIPGATYAEAVVVPEHLLSRLPLQATFQEAAAVPLAALTAWQNLNERMHIKKGDHLLIVGGGGGVGTFAIQIGKYLGATVTAIGGSNSQSLMKKLGADRVINYKKKSTRNQADSFDAIFDCVGGVQQSQLFEVLKPGGRFVSIARKPDEHAAKQVGAKAAFTSISPSGRLMSEIRQLIEANAIHPVVTKVYPFTEKGLKAAHEQIESGHTKGKLVIEIKQNHNDSS